MADAAGIDILAGRLVIGIDRLAQNMAQAGRAVDGFVSRTSSAMRSLATTWQSVGNSLRSVAESASRAMQPLQAGIRNVSTAVTGLGMATAGVSVKLISLASDANEAASKFQFVFKDAAEKTGKAMDEFAEKAGRSRYAMRSMSADIGALIGPMGFTTQKTGELSNAVAKLAVDLSSFFNVSEDDALIALKAGIVGESEPLRRLGVNLNEAKIQQEAFRLGIAKTKDEVNGAIKTQAILSLVFKETQQAQGDAIRTGDQFANSWRRMRDFIKDTATDLGQSFIPIATKYVRSIGDAAKKVAEWAKANQSLITQKVDTFIGKVETVAKGVGSAFVELVKYAKPVWESFGDIQDYAVDLYKSFMQWFSTLPEWAQNAIKVGGALTIIGTALSSFGSAIPILGPFASALGNLVNPANMLHGAFGTLSGAMGAILPLIGVGGSLLSAVIGFAAAGGPIALLIAAIVGAGGLVYAMSSEGGLTGAMEGVASTLKGSFTDAFAAGKSGVEAFVAYLKGDADEAIGHVHQSLGKLADAVGMKGIGAEMKALGEAEVQQSKTAPKLHEKRAGKFGVSGAKSLEIKDQAERAYIEHSQKLREMESLKKSNPMAFSLSVGDTGLQRQRELVQQAESIRALARRKAEERMSNPTEALAGTELAKRLAGGGKALVGGINSAAETADEIANKVKDGFSKAAQLALDNLQKGKTYNQAMASEKAEADRKAKMTPEQIKQSEAIKSMMSSMGLNLGQGDDKKKVAELTKVQEQAKLDFAKSNASSVAQANNSVQKAQAQDNSDASGAYNVDVTGGVIPGTQFKKPKNPPKPAKPLTAAQRNAQYKQLVANRAALAQGTAEGRVSQFMPSEGTDVIAAADYSGEAIANPGKIGVLSKQDANKNLATDLQQNRASDREALQGLRQNLQGQQGGQQQFQMIFQQLQKSQQLQTQALQEENAERRKALLEESDMRRQAANAMLQANQDGVKGIKGLADAANKAGVDMDKLDQAEKDRIAKENGQPTAAQQQAMAQQQQFAQQFQQGFMQAAQNAAQQQGQAMQEGAQAMLQQALGGPGEVQAMIDEASAKGDMKSAYALIRQRLEKQLAVSMSNLHNLASDPMAGGGFGPEHGGQSNDAYFMTLDIPLVRLIKFLKAQLNALPKMAMGGVITKPTQLIAGENGPEAIIPLSAINTGPLSMLQQVLSGAFTGMRGGGLTAGMLGSFGSAFRNAQYWLSSAMDVGMPGAAAQLSRWAATQQSASSFLDNLYRYRQIDLSPGGYGTSYGPAFNPNSRMISSGGYSGMENVVINATFHGTDFTNPSQVRQAANQLYDHLANAARSRGRDMSGRDPLRAPTNAGAPNVNAVAAFRS